MSPVLKDDKQSTCSSSSDLDMLGMSREHPWDIWIVCVVTVVSNYYLHLFFYELMNVNLCISRKLHFFQNLFVSPFNKIILMHYLLLSQELLY